MSEGSPPASSRMFQIHEADLAELERVIPRLTERLWTPDMDNQTKVQIRRVQRIMTDVRWNYGPPQEIHNE